MSTIFVADSSQDRRAYGRLTVRANAFVIRTERSAEPRGADRVADANAVLEAYERCLADALRPPTGVGRLTD